jgi:hypothetical protein
MIWSLAGTSGGRQVAITTGTSTSRQTETPTPAPSPPTNDARASSTRATKGPDIKEHKWIESNTWCPRLTAAMICLGPWSR